MTSFPVRANPPPAHVGLRLIRVPRLTRTVSLLLAVYLVWAVGVLMTHAYNSRKPEAAPSVVLCPMKLTTGLPCPTCGGTRAVTALAGLHLACAFRFNPLLTIAVPLTLALIVLRLGWGLVLRVQLSPRGRSVARSFAAAVFILNWVWVIRVGN